MAAPVITGGRREFTVVCTSCGKQTSVPPSAIARNAFFCGMCGKPIDLQGAFRSFADQGGVAPRRDSRDSKYKSARKGRR